jgi:hypothetical protein
MVQLRQHPRGLLFQICDQNPFILHKVVFSGVYSLQSVAFEQSEESAVSESALKTIGFPVFHEFFLRFVISSAGQIVRNSV